METTNSKNNEQRVIVDLKEFLWKLLEQWKALVAFIVIFTLLFSAFLYWKSNKGFDEGAESIVLTPEEQLEQYSENDQARILSAVRTQKSIINYFYYMSYAPLMQLNPNNVNNLEMIWSVDGDNGLLSAMEDAYTSDITVNEIAGRLSETMGGHYIQAYASEMIRIESNFTEKERMESDPLNIKVTVFIQDDKDIEAIKKAVSEGIHAASEKLKTSVGNHSLSLIYEGTYRTASEYVSELQKKASDEMSSLYTQKRNIQDNLTAGMKRTYNNLLSGNSSPVNPTEKVPFFSLKNLILGVILSLVVYLFVFAVKVIVSGRIQSSSHAKDLFGINTLGECYPKADGSIISAAFCDYNIVKNRHKGQTDIQKNTSEACETITAISKNNNYQNLLMVSNAKAEAHTKEFSEALKSGLKENGIEINETSIDCRNGLTAGENSIMSSDGVFMILDKKKSSLKDIKDICAKCDYCNVPLLGAVYLG